MSTIHCSLKEPVRFITNHKVNEKLIKILKHLKFTDLNKGVVSSYVTISPNGEYELLEYKELFEMHSYKQINVSSFFSTITVNK